MVDLQQIIDKATKLPTPPQIALQILKAVRDEDNTFEDLAEIVIADPALTAQILKLANSSFYSLPREITSLSQATGLLGLQGLKNIALSFVLVDALKDIPKDGFNLDLFWRRSISTAVAAKLLAKATKLKKDDDVFITALLQDIGILVLFLSDKDKFTEIFDNKRLNGTRQFEEEQDQLGFDHSELGAFLLKSWDLPETIYEPIRHHHVNGSRNSVAEANPLFNIADKISSLYHGSQGNKKFTEIYDELTKKFNLNQEEVDELIDAIGEQSREVMDLFAVDPGEMKPFSQLIQEANDELKRLNFSYQQVVFELKQAKQNAEQLAIELKEANDRLRTLAFKDDLTGLYNHRYFQEVFEKELERSKRYSHPVSLLLLDVDRFKNINDTYGHPAGDRVLQQIGSAMSKLVRKSDMVARYGGEEFAIILPETELPSAKVLAQRIRRGIAQLSIPVSDESINVTISIGLASLEKDKNGSRSLLIERADKALYAAKRNGRNRIEC